MELIGKFWWRGGSRSQSGAERKRDSEHRQVLEGILLSEGTENRDIAEEEWASKKGEYSVKEKIILDKAKQAKKVLFKAIAIG